MSTHPPASRPFHRTKYHRKVDRVIQRLHATESKTDHILNCEIPDIYKFMDKTADEAKRCSHHINAFNLSLANITLDLSTWKQGVQAILTTYQQEFVKILTALNETNEFVAKQSKEIAILKSKIEDQRHALETKEKAKDHLATLLAEDIKTADEGEDPDPEPPSLECLFCKKKNSDCSCGINGHPYIKTKSVCAHCGYNHNTRDCHLVDANL